MLYVRYVSHMAIPRQRHALWLGSLVDHRTYSRISPSHSDACCQNACITIPSAGSTTSLNSFTFLCLIFTTFSTTVLNAGTHSKRHR